MRYIIRLSNADFVTGIERNAVSSVPSAAHAKRFASMAEAREALRTIKAKFDSAAEIITEGK